MATTDQHEVVGKYLELLQLDHGQFYLHMAPNSTMDWFGRQVRGPVKIYDYLRTEVNSQYEHKGFDNAKECSSIEYKPMHHKTKSIPTDEIDLVRPKNRVSGIKSLKTYAESDLDDDDVDMVPLPPLERTPRKYGNFIIEELTPPSSTIKVADHSETESDEDEGDACGATKAKRLKYTHAPHFKYLRRMQTTGSAIMAKKRSWNSDEHRSIFDDASSDDDDGSPKQETQKEYTILFYLETTGVLRSLANDGSNNTETRNWERPVRIRMSYRRNISDQQIQFALIIYEHWDQNTKRPISVTRRNLMSEFSASGTEINSSERDMDDFISTDNADDLPLLVLNDDAIETSAATTSLGGITALDNPVSPIEGLRTPTKRSHTPPATPKRKPRLPYAMSGMKRLNLSPSTSSTPKRTALRHLRL